jgi:hypothetical protein
LPRSSNIGCELPELRQVALGHVSLKQCITPATSSKFQHTKCNNYYEYMVLKLLSNLPPQPTVTLEGSISAKHRGTCGRNH